MLDRDVVEAFVSGGARKAFGPELHIEGDALFLDGWWQTAFRISPEVFILRNEEPPHDSHALKHLVDALAARGLQEVGIDLPAMVPIVYVELTLGDASWILWSTDLTSGEQALATRATTESFFGVDGRDCAEIPDFGAELGGARRIAGLPAALILVVGLAPDWVQELDASLEGCQVVSRTLEEITPHGCGALMPTLIVVDASNRGGRDFIAGLRADASCQVLPVVALAEASGGVTGADVCLHRDGPPCSWAESLRRILP
jgi:hypothetical protein